MGLALLAGIATVAAVALVAPVRVAIDVDSARSPRPVELDVRWLLLHWTSGRGPRRPRRPPAPSRPWSRHRWSVRVSPALLHRGVRLLRELLRVVTPVELRGHVCFGLDDPDDTGVAYGLLMAASAGRAATIPLEITPNFDGPALGGDAVVAWSIRPIAVVWPVLTFVIAPAVWRSVQRRPRASGAAVQA